MADVAADRPAVADLRRADGSSRLREGTLIPQLPKDPRVRQAGPEHHVRAALIRLQLGDAGQVEDRGRSFATGVDRHHEVGTAGDGRRVRERGLRLQGVGESLGDQDLHAATLSHSRRRGPRPAR